MTFLLVTSLGGYYQYSIHRIHVKETGMSDNFHKRGEQRTYVFSNAPTNEFYDAYMQAKKDRGNEPEFWPWYPLEYTSHLPFYRCDQSLVCAICHKDYLHHPLYPLFPFLNILCNGELVKL